MAEALRFMSNLHSSKEQHYATWQKILGLALSLLLSAPLLAREVIKIQSTAAQVRGADATIDQANPGTNSGGAATLTVQSRNGNRNQRAIVQFDLTTLPNVAIKQALLILQATASTTTGFPRTYGAFGLTSFFNELNVTWNTRVAGLTWGAPGGDFGGTATATASVAGNITAATPVQFDITTDVQNWYNGTPNYGTLIKDQTEGANPAATTTFGSRNGTAANAPELDVTFIQNVTNIAAVPGDGVVTVSWGYPAAIGRVNAGEAYAGVLILRRANFPVDKSSVPPDTTDPAMCSIVGTGQVVFDNSALATSFTDNASDPCGAPTDDTTWFYKVFLRDAKNDDATQPITNGSVFTAEISATPSATVAKRQNSVWIAATFSTTLAAPSLFPGSIVMAGSQTALTFGIDAVTGMRKYPPVSLGGAVTGRSPVIDAADSSLAQNVMYVADNDGLVYTLKTAGFDIEDADLSDPHAMMNLVVAACIAAVTVMQLVKDRDGVGQRGFSDAFDPDDQRILDAICPRVEGKTERQKNPHPKGTLAFAAWVIARLGGWIVQLRGEVERVGIDAIAREHLAADGDNFGVHQKRGRPLMPTSTRWMALVVATTMARDGVKARPTMPGPERNSSARRSGSMRTTPLRPAMEAAT